MNLDLLMVCSAWPDFEIVNITGLYRQDDSNQM